MSPSSISSTRIPSPSVKTLCLVTLVSFLLLSSLYSGIAQGAQTTLAWDSNTDPAVAGYRLYWGTQSGQYALLADVGNSTNEVVSDLQDGTTYYFAATAYDNQGNESAYSNEVSYSASAPCTYSISPTSKTFDDSESTGFITVTTQAGCVWTASANGSWMTITSDASGTGSGTVAYALAANTGTAARVVAASVAGQVFTVTQAASQTCAVSVSTDTFTGTGEEPIAQSGSVIENATANAPVAVGSKPLATAQYADYFDTVQMAYIGYYQRPADPAGLVYWAGRLAASGGNLTDIIEAFANSAESRGIYGTISASNITTVVQGIYQGLFSREAETAGLDYYVNGFYTGRHTAATIMLDILFGAQNEDLESLNNKVTAANLATGAAAN